MECIQKINLQCDSKKAVCDKHNTYLLPPPPCPCPCPWSWKACKCCGQRGAKVTDATVLLISRPWTVTVGARRLGVRLNEEGWATIAGFEDEKGHDGGSHKIISYQLRITNNKGFFI